MFFCFEIILTQSPISKSHASPLKSFASSRMADYLIARSGRKPTKMEQMDDSSSISISAAFKMLWDHLKVPKHSSRIFKYKMDLRGQLIDAIMDFYGDFKFQLIKDMVDVHEGDVKHILHYYKSSLQMLDSQKSLLLQHNVNSTFIQPFRDIVIASRDAVQQTYLELLEFMQDNAKLKFLSGNPNCFYKFNSGYKMIEKISSKFGKTNVGHCAGNDVPIKDTKEALTFIADGLKKVNTLFKHANCAIQFWDFS